MKQIIVEILKNYGGEIATALIAALIRFIEKRNIKRGIIFKLQKFGMSSEMISEILQKVKGGTNGRA